MAQQEQVMLFYQWPPDSNATLKYGRYIDPTPGFGFLATSGSSTTITGVDNWRGVNSAKPFAQFTVGTIFNRRSGSGATDADTNWVTTVTNDASVVVRTARTYGTTGVGGWWHQIFKSGTTDNDGWMVVQNARRKAVKIAVTALSSAGVDYSIEGKGWNLDQAPHQILTGTISSATFPSATVEVPILEPVAAIRVGLKTTSGAPNTADRVNVFIIERVGPQEYES